MASPLRLKWSLLPGEGIGNFMRDLVVVSGYYGFGNLGDEAILEQLTNELKRLVPASQIVVLSSSPAETQRVYGVRAASRWDFGELLGLLTHARLFVSGGGGLMQDTKSTGSVLFYGGQIGLAKAMGARTAIYCQGLGPLSSSLAKVICRTALRLSDVVSVRDEPSRLLANGWGLTPELTCDPVWALEPTPLPDNVRGQLASLKDSGGDATPPLVGLSLRESPNFSSDHLEMLDQALADALPENTRLLLLPLQKDRDEPLLDQFGSLWSGRGRALANFDPDHLERPSQWISVIAELDFLISMRLHALIMALKQGVPVVGIAYDPKVALLLSNFEQPILNLTKEPGKDAWKQVIKTAFSGRGVLSEQARAKAAQAKDLSCQNFNLLARILGMQSDS